jgi:hypothetical protein
MFLPATCSRKGPRRPAASNTSPSVSFGTVCALVCLLVPATLRADPPEVVIGAAPQKMPPLTAQEKKRVKHAIDRGIVYLKRSQLPIGIFADGSPIMRTFVCSFASLPGLALLESGVPPTDPAVQAAAAFVRKAAGVLTRTYDISLAILFLDRLRDARDEPLIRSLALRLAAGQTALGGWSYNCPLLNKTQEKKLGELLRKKTRADLPKQLRPPPPRKRGIISSSDPADNSNTQFAILALAAARRHGLPLEYPLGLMELRFRRSESVAGWEYHWWIWGGRPDAYGSMTCAGLLGLAVGRAAAEEKSAPEDKEVQGRPDDSGIAGGLKALGAYLRYPSDISLGAQDTNSGPPGVLNLYFLWSVERVGVLCGVDTIGGTDWYRWGVKLLLPAQRRDGSWLGRGAGGYPVATTCFALLFLRRSDLLPDLRKELAKRVKIVDPGPFTKADLAKKGKKGSKGTDTPDLKTLIGKAAAEDDGPLTVDLGEVPAGKAAERPLRVRGPADFRITAIRGGDAQLNARTDSLPAMVHNLTVTLHLDKAGPFERTLYLQTDLPGQAEVAIRVRVRATAPPGSGRQKE